MYIGCLLLHRFNRHTSFPSIPRATTPSKWHHILDSLLTRQLQAWQLAPRTYWHWDLGLVPEFASCEGRVAAILFSIPWTFERKVNEGEIDSFEAKPLDFDPS
jgi:hypothetical protein